MKANEIIAGLRECRSGIPGHCQNCLVYNQDSGCLDRLHTVAADTLETQQKRIEELEAERRWIPVTERLPEYSDGHVLVTDGDRVKISCRNACYKTASGDIRCAQEYGSGMPVTHWMPLPEPPKEVS